jgi:lipoyl(octanoyl) transferase
MNPWFLLEFAQNDAAFNMALDEALLVAMPRLGRPALRFYGWTEPAASFGYFQKYAAVEGATRLRPLVRRPTGGGIVPHDSDWTYSLAFPGGSEWHSLRAVESYRRAHEWIQAAFAKLGVTTELAPGARKAGAGQCFEGWEQFDLLWHGRKIAGAAQRRNRQGLLIQGSIQPPPLSLDRTDWQKAMRNAGSAMFGTEWMEIQPDAALLEQARELVRSKYSQPDFLRRR